MDLHPSSRIHFLDASGAPLEAPLEWEPALVELGIAPDRWRDAYLSRQGRPLELMRRIVGDRERVVAAWDRAGAGRHRLELAIGDQVEELVIEIAPRKIDPLAFAQLVADLESRLPYGIAVGLDRSGALAGITLEPPREQTLAAEIDRLRRAVFGGGATAGLASILPMIAANPHRILMQQSEWVRRHRARRPRPDAIRDALCRAGNLDENRLPVRVIDARVEHSVDVHENRLVKLFSRQVCQRLTHLLAVIRESSVREELETMREALSKVLGQALFLDEVSTPSFIPDRVTMVLLRRPPYRAALEGYLAFHKAAGVTLVDPRLEAPLEELPALYELWATLLVIEALLETCLTLGYEVSHQRLVRQRYGGLCVEPAFDGRAVLELHHPERQTRVRLSPQRPYPRRSDPASDEPGSISFLQRPDVTLEVIPSEGAPKLYLFDPKYKLDSEESDATADGKPKKVDIDKMHAYRDAIRGRDGSVLVGFAATLYPGSTVEFCEGLVALQAYPGREGELKRRVGAWIRDWLA